jgi:hypothetical protein
MSKAKKKDYTAQSVTLKTVLTYGVESVIGYEHQGEKVTKVWCKLCAKFSQRVRSEL